MEAADISVVEVKDQHVCVGVHVVFGLGHCGRCGGVGLVRLVFVRKRLRW